MDSEILKVLFQQGLPTVLVVGGAMFAAFKVWPWWTTKYLPAKMAMADEADKRRTEREVAREASLSSLRETMHRLTESTSSLQVTVEHLPSAIVAATSVMLKDQAIKIIEDSQQTMVARIANMDTSTASTLTDYENKVNARFKDVLEELARIKAIVLDLQKHMNSSDIDRRISELEGKLIGLLAGAMTQRKETQGVASNRKGSAKPASGGGTSNDRTA